jgi:formimidoylglutamate deiminase
VIHIDEKELASIARSGAKVCACPTTERNLGDGIGPAEEWFARGIGVCFGSDSNTQIDILEDARELEYHVRLKRIERAVLGEDRETGSLARRLFAGATEVGAASIGHVADGRSGDFFTVDMNDPSIAGAEPGAQLSNIVFAAGRSAIRDVYVGGRRVVEDGRHAKGEEIVRRFAAAQRRLWG